MSGSEHRAQMIEFEVRQGTLGADDRGRGLAGNTGSARSRLRPGREHCSGGLRLSSGSERRAYWAQMIAVEDWQGILAAQDRG